MALGSDPHSYANYLEAIVTRLDLDVAISFAKKNLSGHVDLTVKAVKDDVKFVSLDAMSLDITSVIDKATSEALEYKVGPLGELSQQLQVWPKSWPAEIRVKFSTTAGCKALTWLTAQQTKGKKQPLVFSQCQAICARSLFPCQDTPVVKMPFGIKVSAPKPLEVVASGKRISVKENGDSRVFQYEQTIPVMSYLVAIICGNLTSRKVGPRSSIWIEPEEADAAQKEFGDITEKFIVAAEKICGSEYCWGLFDVAILPRSFGYGGMENPNVTFFSSALLAGDGSLLTTLAHEITHSWSGNLVTNGRWKDFWLNEGFTRYIERRILNAIYGNAFRSLVLTVGYNDLLKTVDMLCSTGSKGLTRLEPEIVGIDPDQAFSRVPYEKGSLFMYYLEQVVGGEEPMTEWLTAYIKEYAQKSIETSDFKEHFVKFFTSKGKDLSGVDWEHWIQGEGMPSFELDKYTDPTLLDGCRKLSDLWLAGAKAIMHKPMPDGVAAGDLDGRKAQEVMVILDNLINAGAGAMPGDRLDAMDELYKLSSTRNVEVAFRWILLNLKNEHREVFPLVRRFLTSQGRGSYVRPIYIALNNVDHDFAVSVFREGENFYSEVIAKAIRTTLKVCKRIDMRVTTKRNVAFYVRAAESLLEEKCELNISGLGDAISVAVQVAAELERAGTAEISKTETGRFEPDADSGSRSCAQVSVIMRVKEKK